LAEKKATEEINRPQPAEAGLSRALRTTGFWRSWARPAQARSVWPKTRGSGARWSLGQEATREEMSQNLSASFTIS
jgi:hypothetical protein